jgi:predicted amidohydrolase
VSGNGDSVRVAAIQAAPIFLDRDATLDKGIGLIREAAAQGADLAAFGEGWLPGYPIHALTADGSELWWELAAAYLDQAVEIDGPVTDALCSAAREAGIDVAIGVAERDPITKGSVYSTQLLIGSEGQIIGRHRKMKSTPRERAVWADGDTIGLNVHERGYACISALSSCEHQMVLPTYALAEQGTQIHVASWPGGDAAPPGKQWAHQHLLSRAFAVQTGAYIVCVGGILTPAQIPEKYRAFLTQPLHGDSVVIDPRGEIIAGPGASETIVMAECPLAAVRAAKVAFDCAGHASRSDQLKFWNRALGAPEDEGQDAGYTQGFQADNDPGAEPEQAFDQGRG